MLNDVVPCGAVYYTDDEAPADGVCDCGAPINMHRINDEYGNRIN